MANETNGNGTNGNGKVAIGTVVAVAFNLLTVAASAGAIMSRVSTLESQSADLVRQAQTPPVNASRITECERRLGLVEEAQRTDARDIRATLTRLDNNTTALCAATRGAACK